MGRWERKEVRRCSTRTNNVTTVISHSITARALSLRAADALQQSTPLQLLPKPLW